jgi:hypothetical protein
VCRRAFGYKNHVNVNRTHKLIRRYAVIDAAVHDSRKLNGLLHRGNTSKDVFGDSAYGLRISEHANRERDWLPRGKRKARRDTGATGKSTMGSIFVPYTEHVPPDVTACIFWLKNRRPKEWRDRVEHEHEHNFIAREPLSEEEFAAKYGAKILVGRSPAHRQKHQASQKLGYRVFQRYSVCTLISKKDRQNSS